jgi:hypothetical protein
MLTLVSMSDRVMTRYVLRQMGEERCEIMMLWPQVLMLSKRDKDLNEMADAISMLDRRQDGS